MSQLKDSDHQKKIDLLIAAGIQWAEANQPELKGQAKKAVVVDAVEQKILDIYSGVDAFLYDFPPLVDLAVSAGVPHLTETVDIVKKLRPIIEDSIDKSVNFFKNLGWFGE